MADPTNASPSKSKIIVNLQAQFVDGINLQTADRPTLQNYVAYVVQTYIDDNMEDEHLWEGIHFDFEDFTEEHFKKLDTSTRTWNLLRDYCYAHGYWIDHNFEDGKTRASTMLKAVKADWHNKWTMEQIKWVEKRYNVLSKMTIKRKQELIGITSPPTNLANPPIVPAVPAVPLGSVTLPALSASIAPQETIRQPRQSSSLAGPTTLLAPAAPLASAAPLAPAAPSTPAAPLAPAASLASAAPLVLAAPLPLTASLLPAALLPPAASFPPAAPLLPSSRMLWP
ncbi:hypothetical protein MMC29_000067 [Sticta canariensis]|nr:hypothetical protein [Sticta canariensis]